MNSTIYNAPIVPMRDLQRKWKEVVVQLKESKEPVIVMSRYEAQAAILPMELFLQFKIYQEALNKPKKSIKK